MLSFLIAAAEPSKVPFYIAGALLAVWAVVLAGIGLTQPSFPGSERGARGVMTISLVLIVIAIGAGILTDP
jgi:trimethylamine:corrinoid methyltransferase-like protein